MDSGVFRGARAGVVVAAVAALLAVSVTGAAAQPTIDVTVDGEPTTDGERVTVGPSPTVNVSVPSSADLNYVEITVDGRTIGEGVDEDGFNRSHSPDTPFGTTRYVVRATESDGSTTAHEVLLDRPAETPAEIRDQLDRIERELDDLEAQNEHLEEQRENLTAENDRLRQRLNESDGGDGGTEGLPGFGAVVAVTALVALTVTAARRRRSR